MPRATRVAQGGLIYHVLERNNVDVTFPHPKPKEPRDFNVNKERNKDDRFVLVFQKP